MNLQKLFTPAPVGGGFSMEGYWVWCGSVIHGEDGNYHMFASRWRNTLPMHPGWLVESEIVRAQASRPEGPYHFCEVVLPARGPQYWDGMSTHNPHIKKIGDTYVLYYIGMTYPYDPPRPGENLAMDDPRVAAARANKRIGMAVSKSVFGPWKRSNHPILNPRPEHFDNFFVSNPAPCVDEEGGVHLLYKTRSYTPGGARIYGDMSFGAAYASKWAGPYRPLRESPVFPATLCHLEDPFIWKSCDGYHMIAKDMDGRVCGEPFAGVSAHSDNGSDWTIEKDSIAYSRTIVWNDGVQRTMGALERPFILFEQGKATHIFFATSDGPGGFMHASRTWNMCIPLREGITGN